MANTLAFTIGFFLVWAALPSVHSQTQLPRDKLVDSLTEAMDNFANALGEEKTCESVVTTLSKFGTVTGDPEHKVVLILNGNLSICGVFGNFDLLCNIFLKDIIFDCDSKTLTVTTRSYGNQTLIPPQPGLNTDLSIHAASLFLSVSLTDEQSLEISFVGSLKLSSTLIDVSVLYKKAIQEYNITASLSGPIDDVSTITEEFTGFSLPIVISKILQIDSLVISGVIKKMDNSTWLTVKFVGEAATIFLVLQLRENKPWYAIALESYNISFSALLNETLSADLGNVPYFGTVTAPKIALTMSSEQNCDLPDGIFYGINLEGCIEDGLNINASFNFSIIPLIVTYEQQGKTLTLVPPLDVVMLRELLEAVDPDLDLNTVPFPFDIKTIYCIGIKSISISLSKDADPVICIDLMDSKGMYFFDNLMILKSSDIEICLARKMKIGVTATGIISIDNFNFKSKLTRAANDSYTVSASADTLPIDAAISQFEAQIFPPEISEELSNSPFSKFYVKDPTLTYHVSSENKQIEIGGRPVIGTYSGLEMYALLVKDTKNDLVVGFSIESVKLADLLHDISQMCFDEIPMLNQNVDATLLISPATLPDNHLEGLPNVSITKGLSVQANMHFASDCSSNKFCKIAQKLLGKDASFTLQGTMESVKSFSLSADLTDLNLGNGYILKSAGFDITVGESNSFGISGSLSIPNPKITFAGEIAVGLNGVELKLSESGCWNDAFGQNWLAICNLLGSISMEPGIPIPSELSIGGEIKLGNKACSTPLVAEGYVGIDFATPTNNYYYVQFNKATVGSIFKAFCWGNIDLPRPLKESGFPNGFLSSFSWNGKDLPSAGLSIPAGYHFKGTLNILGLQGSADVNIDFPNGIIFDVELPPISIAGGLLSMRRSEDDRSKGPFLKANVTISPPVFDISASGYISVLGFDLDATLMITDHMYKFTASDKILNLFEADVTVSAYFSSHISDASFQVKGGFKFDLFDMIEQRIKNVLQGAADDANNKIQAAKRAVDSKKQIFDNANTALESAKQKVNEAYSSFYAAENSLDNAKNKVKAAFAKCPSWLRWICDPIIDAANGILTAAEWTVQAASHSLDLAKDVLTGCQDTMNGAKEILQAAEEVLQGLYDTYKFALDAADKITNFGLNGLISIKAISFDVELSAANSASFDVSVTASFLGESPITLDLHIDMRDLEPICKDLSGHIGDGFGSLF